MPEEKSTRIITGRELQSLYDQGVNISQYLRNLSDVTVNSPDIIEMAYDLQAGTYIHEMEDAEVADYKRKYTREIARVIMNLCNKPVSIMEAGIGEATTLSGVLGFLGVGVKSFGFDISWSRVAYARKWTEKQGLFDVTLCTGDLLNIPFVDNSIDVVYTSHSIEPNGGAEEEILRELFRVTRQYLILCEPGYELAGIEARTRMDSHGYCKNLKGVAENLGYNVLEHSLFPYTQNELNPTAITIIKKSAPPFLSSHPLACPKSKLPLTRIEDTLYCTESSLVYPIIGGVPCLRTESGILASKYMEIMGIK